jgi:hypothetical protein
VLSLPRVHSLGFFHEVRAIHGVEALHGVLNHGPGASDGNLGGFGYRNGDRVGVDIQPTKRTLDMSDLSFRMRLCAAGFTSSQRNPRYCETAVAPS